MHICEGSAIYVFAKHFYANRTYKPVLTRDLKSAFEHPPLFFQSII